MYCKIIVRYGQVLPVFVRYYQELPKLKKKKHFSNLSLYKLFIWYHIVFLSTIKYMLGIVQYHICIAKYQ